MSDWKTVEDLLPLLKYEFPVPSPAFSIPHSTDSVPNASPGHDNKGLPALTTSLKVGWICFGIGAAVAWIFPPAYVFYSIGLIMAIVALCTRQASHGIVLLLSSFVAMATSAFISIFFAGTLFSSGLGVVANRTEQRIEAAQPDIQMANVPGTPFRTFTPNPQSSGDTTKNRYAQVATRDTRRSQEAAPASRREQSTPPRPPEEITVPLRQWTNVASRFGSFSVKIVDHGPVTISVGINGSELHRIEKVKGFETTGTNITPIHHLGAADVYYVDRISVPLGHCVIKIFPAN